MKSILLLLLLPVILAGQTIEYETNNTFNIDSIVFHTYTLKIDNRSSSDPAIIFVVPEKQLDSVIVRLRKVSISRKQEFTEYHIIGISSFSKEKTNQKALLEFITQIDSSRVLRNRSTFLKKYSLDKITNKIIYHPTTKKLSEIVNLYYLTSTKDLCKFLSCSPFH